MKRVPELDSIRGLAALAIVLYHLFPARFTLLWAGVDCFFVLSSFLITSILLEYRGSSKLLRSFYVRRALRIWPIYYLLLLALLGANHFLRIGERVDALPWYVTYTQNISLLWGVPTPPFIRAFEHTWTLALEEQYYLIWPIFVLKLRRPHLIVVSVALAIMCVILRQAGMSVVTLAGRCDGFALGGLIAVLMSADADDDHAAQAPIALFTLSALVGVAALFVSATGLIPITVRIEFFTLAFFGILGLTVSQTGASWLTPLRWYPLRYLGAVSYGLYLYHVPLDRGMEIVLRHFGVFHRLDVGYPLWRSIIELLLAVVVASLSWHFIEQPLIRLKSRFAYS